MRAFFKDIKDGVLAVFKGETKTENIYSLNGKVPVSQGIAFGIQHIFAMFIANIAPLLILFSTIGLFDANAPAEVASLATNAIRGTIFVAGIGTIIQVLLGARLPIVIGASFTFVGLFTSFFLNIEGTSAGVYHPIHSVESYYTIMASIIIGGLFIAIMGPFVKWWSKIIKPIVTAIVVLGIGLSLLPVGAEYFLGGASVIGNSGISNSIFLYYIIVGVFTLLVGLLWNLLIPGVWKNLNIVVAIVGGYLLALIFNYTVAPGMLDFSSLHIAGITDIINVPTPVDFSKLIFKPVPIVLTCIIFLVASIEGIGDSRAVCTGGLGRDITTRELGGVITVDGFSSFLAGVFGSLPLTTFSQNVGIVSQTKIVNRFTIFLGACFLVVCGFFPPLANFLLTIPYCVLGGAIIIVFGSIAVSGIIMIKNQGFSEKNILIVSLSVCLGYGITLVDSFFSRLQSGTEFMRNLAIIISNPLINMFVVSMILSWILPEDMHISLKRK